MPRRAAPCALLLALALLGCAAEPLRMLAQAPPAGLAQAWIRDMTSRSELDGDAGVVGARVVAVDGVPLAGEPSAIELDPGRHELRIECRWKGRAATVETSAELVAGRSYVIALGVDASGAPDALIVEAGP